MARLKYNKKQKRRYTNYKTVKTKAELTTQVFAVPNNGEFYSFSNTSTLIQRLPISSILPNATGFAKFSEAYEFFRVYAVRITLLRRIPDKTLDTIFAYSGNDGVDPIFAAVTAFNDLNFNPGVSDNRLVTTPFISKASKLYRFKDKAEINPGASASMGSWLSVAAYNMYPGQIHITNHKTNETMKPAGSACAVWDMSVDLYLEFKQLKL